MTYSNYNGYHYMGIDRPALVRAFKDLRRQDFTARLGRSLSDGHMMHSDLVTDGTKYGAAWTLTADEGLTWMENWGHHQASSGNYQPLAIYCTGYVNGQDAGRRGRWSPEQVAGYVFGVLEIHGLHPYLDEGNFSNGTATKVIKLAPSTRLDRMTEDDKAIQRNRLAQHNEAVAQAEALRQEEKARQHESRIRGYIDRYAKVLCDQGLLRSREGTDVVERLELRQETIDQFLMELRGIRSHVMGVGSVPTFTSAELARIVTDGANMAHERLRSMLNDVTDGGVYGNGRAEELLRLAPESFPWLT
jgi:hypothetical protein